MPFGLHHLFSFADGVLDASAQFSASSPASLHAGPDMDTRLIHAVPTLVEHRTPSSFMPAFWTADPAFSSSCPPTLLTSTHTDRTFTYLDARDLRTYAPQCHSDCLTFLHTHAFRGPHTLPLDATRFAGPSFTSHATFSGCILTHLPHSFTDTCTRFFRSLFFHCKHLVGTHSTVPRSRAWRRPVLLRRSRIRGLQFYRIPRTRLWTSCLFHAPLPCTFLHGCHTRCTRSSAFVRLLRGCTIFAVLVCSFRSLRHVICTPVLPTRSLPHTPHWTHVCLPLMGFMGPHLSLHFF